MSSEEQAYTILDICSAAEKGDTALLKNVIAAAPHLVCQDTAANDEHQAIHHAVYGGHTEAVRLLLAAGADPLNGIYPHREATTAYAMAQDRGMTDIVEVIDAWLSEHRGASSAGQQFTEAAEAGDYDTLIRMLDEQPNLINATDVRGRTALFKAIDRGTPSMVNLLLDRGTAVDHRDANGESPLAACLFHSWKVPDDQYAVYTAIGGILIGRGAPYTVWAAAAMGDVEGVHRKRDEIEEALQDPNGPHPVTVTAFRGHAEALHLLLDAGADPDAPYTINVAGETIDQWGQPLWLACNRGHHEVVELLLKRGARANVALYASGSAVQWPYQAGNRRTADLMFLYGAVGDPLSYCLIGDMAALSEHLAAHPDEGKSLLWSALLAGNETVVEHTLTQGPPVPKEQQFTLLSQAIRGWRIGNLKINNENWDRRSLQRNLERLLDHGFNPNLRNNRTSRADFTILHHLAAKTCNAAAYGHTEEEMIDFARVLIDAGADVNALENQLMSTPLAWAARQGNGTLVRYLLSRGADPDLAGSAWATPMAWAERKNHEDIASLLVDKGTIKN